MLLHQSSGRWQLGLTLALAATALWGVLPVAEVVILQELDVYTLIWFRFLMSFGLLALYLRIRQPFATQAVDFKAICGAILTRSPQLWLLIIAALGLAGDYLFYLLGLARTSPGNTEVLIQLSPLLLGLGAIALFQERYTRYQWMGVGVLVCGFTLFFKEQLRTLITSSPDYLIGSGWIVVAAIAWAIYALAQKQLLHSLPSTHIMLGIYGICTLLFTPFADPQRLLMLSPLGIALLIFCGFNTIFAYGAFSESLEHWDASKVSAVIALTPIITLGMSWAIAEVVPNLLPPERITLLGLCGIVFVIVGSVLVALGKHND
ncbi:MAG: DMT family transporter [Oculatellaceae cyanobacterium bins.114]|nr:DMT family transporter [Oculatellaceae cyanobacterium bins.114]